MSGKNVAASSPRAPNVSIASGTKHYRSHTTLCILLICGPRRQRRPCMKALKAGLVIQVYNCYNSLVVRAVVFHPAYPGLQSYCHLYKSLVMLERASGQNYFRPPGENNYFIHSQLSIVVECATARLSMCSLVVLVRVQIRNYIKRIKARML